MMKEDEDWFLEAEEWRRKYHTSFFLFGRLCPLGPVLRHRLRLQYVRGAAANLTA
jgi:hypothetical protein